MAETAPSLVHMSKVLEIGPGKAAVVSPGRVRLYTTAEWLEAEPAVTPLAELAIVALEVPVVTLDPCPA